MNNCTNPNVTSEWKSTNCGRGSRDENFVLIMFIVVSSVLFIGSIWCFYVYRRRRQVAMAQDADLVFDPHNADAPPGRRNAETDPNVMIPSVISYMPSNKSDIEQGFSRRSVAKDSGKGGQPSSESLSQKPASIGGATYPFSGVDESYDDPDHTSGQHSESYNFHEERFFFTGQAKRVSHGDVEDRSISESSMTEDDEDIVPVPDDYLSQEMPDEEELRKLSESYTLKAIGTSPRGYLASLRQNRSKEVDKWKRERGIRTDSVHSVHSSVGRDSSDGGSAFSPTPEGRRWFSRDHFNRNMPPRRDLSHKGAVTSESDIALHADYSDAEFSSVYYDDEDRYDDAQATQKRLSGTGSMLGGASTQKRGQVRPVGNKNAGSVQSLRPLPLSASTKKPEGIWKAKKRPARRKRRPRARLHSGSADIRLAGDDSSESSDVGQILAQRTQQAKRARTHILNDIRNLIAQAKGSTKNMEGEATGASEATSGAAVSSVPVSALPQPPSLPSGSVLSSGSVDPRASQSGPLRAPGPVNPPEQSPTLPQEEELSPRAPLSMMPATADVSPGAFARGMLPSAALADSSDSSLPMLEGSRLNIKDSAPIIPGVSTDLLPSLPEEEPVVAAHAAVQSASSQKMPSSVHGTPTVESDLPSSVLERKLRGKAQSNDIGEDILPVMDDAGLLPTLRSAEVSSEVILPLAVPINVPKLSKKAKKARRKKKKTRVKASVPKPASHQAPPTALPQGSPLEMKPAVPVAPFGIDQENPPSKASESVMRRPAMELRSSRSVMLISRSPRSADAKPVSTANDTERVPGNAVGDLGYRKKAPPPVLLERNNQERDGWNLMAL